MVLSMERWVGKIAVVTGASAGIGEKIAEELVRQGMKVVGIARRSELIEQKALTLADLPGELHAVRADVSKEDELINAFKVIQEKYGPVSVLINNAGIVPRSSLIEGDVAVWKDVLNTNLLGLCVATQEAISMMKSHGIDGHIIHINSIAGHLALPLNFLGIYSASKYGVTSLTQSLRKELLACGSKIRVTSLSPGVVESNVTENMEELLEQPKLLREDIADAVVYALSTPPHVQIHELTIRPIGEQI